MGMSSLAVIFSIIQQVYDIDYKVQFLYQQKRNLSKWSQLIGVGQSNSTRLSPKQVMRVRLIDWSGDKPAFSAQRYTNQVAPGGQGWMIDTDPFQGAVSKPGAHPLVVKTYNPAYIHDPVNQPELVDAPAGQLAYDPNGQPLTPGEAFMSKEEAEALYNGYLKEIKAKEEEIDMELETLKARRQALVSQREEFTKYIGEGIKTTFRNSYQA